MEVRKTVTMVFADVTGSTALGERLDRESLRGMMSRYFDEMRAAVEGHCGTVEKFIGDAVMAAFGVPVLHEGRRPPGGSGGVGDARGQSFVTGDAVAVAACLEQAAEPGKTARIAHARWTRGGRYAGGHR